VGFIGCEPFLNGIASLLRDVQNKQLANIRILADDARPFLARLPDNSIDRLFILFPDPWRKKRHENRRIIQKNILDQFYKLLKIGGEFRVATDDPVYLRWILLHLKDHPGFEWLARRPNDWRLRPADWPQTRYEKKALTEGRTPIFLRYQKI
jgi:tRNA (guanine-N7-)-methyltransferase